MYTKFLGYILNNHCFKKKKTYVVNISDSKSSKIKSPTTFVVIYSNLVNRCSPKDPCCFQIVIRKLPLFSLRMANILIFSTTKTALLVGH